VVPGQFGWQVGKASDTHTGGIPSGDYEVVARDPRRGDEYEAVFQAQAELVTGMLAIDFEIEKEGMTVPYPPLFNDIRRNHGFVDLRGRPELAIEISESSQSPTLKAILVELSEPDSPLFTLGCDLGTHEEPWRVESARHVAGGYVQLMCASYSDRSPEDYTTFGYAIAQVLGEKAQDYNWFVRFMLKLVVLISTIFQVPRPRFGFGFTR